MTSRDLGPFVVEVAAGIAVVTFDKPPVNAFDLATYAALREVIDLVESDDRIRVMVLTAPLAARSWCGGADLRDFVGMDSARRKERYEFINTTVPRLYSMNTPVIAAITGHAIGVGVLLAAACDLRYAATSASFSCPEIDYGLIAGSSRLLNYLGMPEGLVREMGYTGRRMSAERLMRAGFLNDVVAGPDVLATAMATAQLIAAKSLPVLQARKQAFIAQEELGWLAAYKLAQGFSADLVTLSDAREGVEAFLESREASISDG
ncbi:MAG: enoyl-CoA hydratase/isomerase family protein [Nocardioides sp.]|nr:enoyl-CoA hydratase/isomerase family protein [Nocardioides sp.]